MPEQLQKILDRVVEWWKKFSNKQKNAADQPYRSGDPCAGDTGSCCIKTELYNTD